MKERERSSTKQGESVGNRDRISASLLQEAFLLDAIPFPIFFLDETQTVTRVNRAFTELLERIGADQNVVGLMLPDALPFLYKDLSDRFESVFTNQEIIMFRKQCDLPEGRFVSDICMIPIIGADRVEGIMAIIHDATESDQREQFLRERESKYRKIVEDCESGYFRIGKDGCFEQVNNAWLRMHELSSPDQIIGKHYSEIHAAEELEDTRRIIQRVMAGESISGEKFRHKNADGSVRYHIFSAVPVVHNGEVVAIEGFATDVTECMKAHVSLEETSRFLQSVFNSIQDGLSVLSTDLTIRQVNSTMNRWYAANLPLEGKKCYEAYHNSSVPCDPCPSLRCMESKTIEHEVVHGLPGSDTVWIELFSYPMFDRSGNVTGVVEFVRDITDRVEATEALRKSRERYDRATRAGKTGVWEWNTKTGQMYIDPFLKESLGYGNDEIGNNIDAWKSIIHPDDVNIFMKRAEEYISGAADSYEVEHRMYHKDGSVRWYLARGSLLNGSTPIISGTSTDISQLKEAEIKLKENSARLENTLAELRRAQRQLVQQERLAALGELASGIAHDFNNSLAPILGLSDLMMEMPDILDDREKTLEYLAMINRSAKDAADVVARLREFYRSPDDRDQFGTVDISKLVGETVNFTSPVWKTQALSEGISIDVNTELKDGILINGSRASLKRAMTNIILNSIDAMPYGGTLTVRCHAEGDKAIIEFVDTGQGMTEDVASRCMEPFFTTKGTRSSGLGLSVAHGIISRHGGQIQIDSKPGKGTRVVLTLPTIRRTQEEQETAPEKTQGQSLHVLAIDDDERIRNMIGVFLELHGCTFETASDGVEGVSKFREGNFDLVITDRAMPGMNGIEVSMRIKEISPQTPVIMLTGFGDMMISAGEMPPSVDLILGKPITLDKFRQALIEIAKRNHVNR